MRKVFFLLIFFFFQLFFALIFTFPAHGYNRCYTTDLNGNSVFIGDMHAWMTLRDLGENKLLDFLSIGQRATVEFADKLGDVTSDGEVIFKIGNSSWVPYQFKARYYSWEYKRYYTSYFVDFSPKAEETCAAYYINVRWRSIRDGKIHYCDNLSANFQSPSVYMRKVDNNKNSMKGKVLIWDPEGANEIRWQKASSEVCSNFSFYLNNLKVRSFWQSGNYCISGDIYGLYDVNNGYTLRVVDSNGKAPSSDIEGSLRFYEFASNPPTTCGGCQDCGPSIPPPPFCTTCPCSQKQEGGSCKYSLTNVYKDNNPDYKPYIEFTSQATGWVTKAWVRAGNWTNTWRSITCKFKDVLGEEESAEISSALFQASDGINWRELNFSRNPFELKKERTYRLYCRGPSHEGWLTLYWMYECYNPVYGKDYKWDMTICPSPLTCSSATLSPDSFTFEPGGTQVFQVTGLIDSLALLDYDVERIEFTSSNQNIVSVSPSLDDSYPFQATATGLALGGPATITADVFLKPDDGRKDCSGTAMVSVNKISNPWFQTREGNIYAGGIISSKIPSSCSFPSCLPYFSLKGENSNGMISWAGSEEPNFGNGSGGEVNDWQVNSKAKRNFYDYFYQLLWPPQEDNFNGEIIEEEGVYYSNDDVTVDSNWNFPSGKKAVVFINGKLTINKKIIVPKGSFLAFIVKDDIEIDRNLGGGKQSN